MLGRAWKKGGVLVFVKRQQAIAFKRFTLVVLQYYSREIASLEYRGIRDQDRLVAQQFVIGWVYQSFTWGETRYNDRLLIAAAGCAHGHGRRCRRSGGNPER